MPEWVQPSWPQVQTISVLSSIPSQWALQYFSLLGGMQLQAGFAHFLELAIIHSPRSEAGWTLAGFDAELIRRDGG
jgi:hypothetical protein